MVGATSASVCRMILASSSGVEAAAIEPAVSIKVRYSGERNVAIEKLYDRGGRAGRGADAEPAGANEIDTRLSGNASSRSGLLTEMILSCRSR